MPAIYKVLCAECGNELTLKDLELDGGLDLIATVGPCEHCGEERYDTGEHEGFSRGQEVAEDRITVLQEQIAELENQLAERARG